MQSVQYKQMGIYKDKNNNSVSFSCPVQGIGSVANDGPNFGAIQRDGNTIFWIDGPGRSIYYDPTNPCATSLEEQSTFTLKLS
jgi:hypothetical protein